MWWSRRRTLAGLLALPGCSFAPLYAEGSLARGLTGSIAIAPMEGAFGFAMRERLETRLRPVTDLRYVLQIRTSIAVEERAISTDNSITRFTLDAQSAFDITPVGATEPVFADTARAFTAYSAVASPFATRVAEEDARNRLAQSLADQIVLRLATTARDWAA